MVSLNALITQLGSRVKPPVTSNKHGDRGKELAEVWSTETDQLKVLAKAAEHAYFGISM